MKVRQPITLSGADYAVFVVMLCTSAAIGIIFAYRDRKSKSGVQGYLMGGRNMSYLPVSISLSLSFVSAVTILGIPAEIYIFGSMYCWLLFGCILICVIPVTEIFIPIFYRLGITSSFEYLQLRYNYGVRLVATAAYIIQNIMYIGIMIFAPAVALTSVTNLNLWASIFSIGLVCTFYTTLGGLKAVIWTDVLQGFVVLLGTTATLFASAAKAGGWRRVWQLNSEGGRIDFGRFDGDVRVRHSFWSISIGLGFLWMSIFGTSQSQVQRYLCCRTEKDAKKGLWISMAVSGLIFLLTVFTGFVMYAYFAGCDPLLSGEVAAADQLLPYMVLDVFQSHPGLPGLFIASVFSGCLSTVSSGINAMACVTVQDFIRPFVKWQERTLTWWSKGGYQTRKEVNPRLIRPLLDHRIFRWLPDNFRRFMRCGVAYDKVNVHEIIKVPRQLPEQALKRRWSSRERTNSLRLSRRHWREQNAEESAEEWENTSKKSAKGKELLTSVVELNGKEDLDAETADEALPKPTNRSCDSSNTYQPLRNVISANEKTSSVKSGIPSVWI